MTDNNSKLEGKLKKGFFSRIKEIYSYIDHYLMDLTGHLMDGKPMHDHKLTSRDNLLEHSYFCFDIDD